MKQHTIKLKIKSRVYSKRERVLEESEEFLYNHVLQPKMETKTNIDETNILKNKVHQTKKKEKEKKESKVHNIRV